MRYAAGEMRSLAAGGSSTVLLGRVVPGTSTLEVANLGDSGFLLLRPSAYRFRGQSRATLWPRVVLRSAEQTHFFNCPYQVSSDTFQDTIDAGAADTFAVQVQPGDVVVAATDGVFDNLFDRHIQVLVAEHLSALRGERGGVVPEPMTAPAGALHALAGSIAHQAAEVGAAEDEASVATPFSVAAQREGLEYPGGKLDDVAVVVAVVHSDECVHTGDVARLDNFLDAGTGGLEG